MTWVIPALVNDPFLLSSLHVPLEGAIVVADHTPDGIEETIADIVCTGRDQSGSFDVVDDQSLSIWSDSFHNFSVEATITLR